MAYSEKIYRLAADVLAERKTAAEELASRKHDRLTSQFPEILELESKMRQSAYGLVKVIGMGEKTAQYIENLKNENLQAQEEIKNILVSAGYSENEFDPVYTCSKCSDTGIYNGKLCSCHIELLRKLSYQQLCKDSPLQISSFDDFDLSFYKNDSEAYDIMSRIFDFCKNYAENFDTNSNSIFMFGETGLGKTHLSLAIADRVLKKGFGVVYGSVQNLFSAIEKEHFGRSENPDGTTEKMLLECDLLILDDLGAEFTTNFTIATLNNIINTRLLSSKPTIISSNLNINVLNDTYSRRITSRIIGEYRILTFKGKDIRQQKSGF